MAAQDAACHAFDDSLLDRRNELARDHTPNDRVFELEPSAARHGLEIDVADAELTVAAGLLLLLAFDVRRLFRDRLTVGEARGAELRFDASPTLDALERDFEMQHAEPRQKQLARVLVVGERQARIFFDLTTKRCRELVFEPTFDDERT